MTIKTGKNNQQLLFLQGMLQGIKQGKPQQNKVIKINVKDKYQDIPFIIEVYPAANNCLPFRVVTSTGKGHWQSWDELDQIENSFKVMSLL